jgi:hypothetical protein
MRCDHLRSFRGRSLRSATFLVSLIVVLQCHSITGFLQHAPVVTSVAKLSFCTRQHPHLGASLRQSTKSFSSQLTCSSTAKKDASKTTNTKPTKTYKTAKGLKRRTFALMVPSNSKMALRYVVSLFFLIVGRIANVMVGLYVTRSICMQQTALSNYLISNTQVLPSKELHRSWTLSCVMPFRT